MMKSSEYWQKRFELLEQAAHQQGVQCYADIENSTDRHRKSLKVRLLHGISVLHITTG